MLDSIEIHQERPISSALLLFDRAMQMRAIRSDIVRAAQDLNRLTDNQLAELGIDRSDVEDTIGFYI